MKPYASSAPAMFAAILACLGRVALDGEVRDGPAVGDNSAREVITVGYIGPDDDSSAEANLITGGLGGPPAGLQETYQVHCAVAVSTGNEDVQPARERCFELFGLAAGQLALDTTVNALAMNVNVASWALREDMTDAGMVVRIRFDIAVTAYAGR